MRRQEEISHGKQLQGTSVPTTPLKREGTTGSQNDRVREARRLAAVARQLLARRSRNNENLQGENRVAFSPQRSGKLFPKHGTAGNKEPLHKKGTIRTRARGAEMSHGGCKAFDACALQAFTHSPRHARCCNVRGGGGGLASQWLPARGTGRPRGRRASPDSGPAARGVGMPRGRGATSAAVWGS